MQKHMRRGREFWARLVDEFEGAGAVERHKAFADRHGVRCYSFQQWLYRLRRDWGSGGAGSGPPPRSVNEMMYADSRASFERELARFVAEYQAKYPKAVEALVQDKAEISTFFDFPADHWKHLRTTNPIESTFATVKLRSRVTKGAGSRAAGLTMTSKLLRAAEATWRRIDGQALIPLVRAGVRFVDGKQPERDNEEIKIEESKKAGKIAA